jgi:hypothetical protein
VEIVDRITEQIPEHVPDEVRQPLGFLLRVGGLRAE